MQVAVNCLVNDARRKFVLRVDGRVRAQIGHAVAAPEDRLPVVDNEYGRARSVIGFQRGEDGIDLAVGNLARRSCTSEKETQHRKQARAGLSRRTPPDELYG